MGETKYAAIAIHVRTVFAALFILMQQNYQQATGSIKQFLEHPLAKIIEKFLAAIEQTDDDQEGAKANMLPNKQRFLNLHHEKFTSRLVGLLSFPNRFIRIRSGSTRFGCHR
jgi:hypothetical protein